MFSILSTFGEHKLIGYDTCLETIFARRELVKWRESRAEQLQQDKEYCHPRWRQEEKYLKSEIDAVKSLSLVSTSDWWIYFDWACLFLILAAIVAKILFFELDKKHNHKVRIMVSGIVCGSKKCTKLSVS